jgi:hypothetical protein
LARLVANTFRAKYPVWAVVDPSRRVVHVGLEAGRKPPVTRFIQRRASESPDESGVEKLYTPASFLQVLANDVPRFVKAAPSAGHSYWLRASSPHTSVHNQWISGRIPAPSIMAENRAGDQSESGDDSEVGSPTATGQTIVSDVDSDSSTDESGDDDASDVSSGSTMSTQESGTSRSPSVSTIAGKRSREGSVSESDISASGSESSPRSRSRSE